MVELIEDLTIKYNEAIAAGGSLFSRPIDMRKKEGFGSIHVKTTGSGTLKITYQLSNDVNTADADDKDWIDGTTDIVTAHTAGSSLYSMPDESFFAIFLRFKIEETTTTDGVTASIWVATQ
jgi:hypothetical protein